MNDEVIADLKQFISATVVQHTSQLASKIDRVEERLTGVENRLTGVENRLTSVEGRLDTLEERVNDMHITIEDHIFTYLTALDEQGQEHEQRLVAIEQA